MAKTYNISFQKDRRQRNIITLGDDRGKNRVLIDKKAISHGILSEGLYLVILEMEQGMLIKLTKAAKGAPDWIVQLPLAQEINVVQGEAFLIKSGTNKLSDLIDHLLFVQDESVLELINKEGKKEYFYFPASGEVLKMNRIKIRRFFANQKNRLIKKKLNTLDEWMKWRNTNTGWLKSVKPIDPETALSLKIDQEAPQSVESE